MNGVESRIHLAIVCLGFAMAVFSLAAPWLAARRWGREGAWKGALLVSGALLLLLPLGFLLAVVTGSGQGGGIALYLLGVVLIPLVGATCISGALAAAAAPRIARPSDAAQAGATGESRRSWRKAVTVLALLSGLGVILLAALLASLALSSKVEEWDKPPHARGGGPSRAGPAAHLIADACLATSASLDRMQDAAARLGWTKEDPRARDYFHEAGEVYWKIEKAYEVGHVAYSDDGRIEDRCVVTWVMAGRPDRGDLIRELREAAGAHSLRLSPAPIASWPHAPTRRDVYALEARNAPAGSTPRDSLSVDFSTDFDSVYRVTAAFAAAAP